MVRISVGPDHVDIPLRVIPRAKRDEFAGERNGAVCVRLTAPPVEGAANKALAELLSRLLDVPKGNVRILVGDRSREKRVRITTEAPQAVLLVLQQMGIEVGEA